MNFEIGTVTTPNPWLWVDSSSDFNNFRVSTESPGESWIQVNQFCSILAVRWLKNPAQNFGFRDLSAQDQLTDARTLQGFDSLQAQTDYAVAQLGGQQVQLKDLVSRLPNYNPGTQIWFGNNSHTLAGLVRKSGNAKVVYYYNPDTGDTITFQINEFAALVPDWSISAIVVKTA